MSKKIKRFIKIISIISIIVIVPNIPNFYKSIMVSEKEPKDAENYVYIEDLTSDNNFDVRVFTSIYPETAFRLNDSIICISTRNGDKHSEDNISSSWYKVNDHGHILDSLSIRNEYFETQGNYLVNREKEYYLSWLIDGDTLQKSFLLINEGKLIDKADFEKETDSSDFTGYEYQIDSLTNQRFVKTFYFKNGKWNKINTQENFYVTTSSFSNQDEFLGFKDIDVAGKLDFFHKRDWYGHKFPDFNIYFNGKPSEHWRGTGFYSVSANSTKILIKRWGLKLYDDHIIGTPNDLTLYENSTKNYLLISEFEDSSRHTKQVLIRYK